jgi:UDP-N-acetyl-D-mannosaminuronic acid transferase (WecB/TagA/CpsF family)
MPILLTKYKRPFLDVYYTDISFDSAFKTLIEWSLQGLPRRIVFQNAHGALEALNNERYRESVKSSDMVLTDGWPVSLFNGIINGAFSRAERIPGPDMMESSYGVAVRRRSEF